jgi:manganese transport protein
MSVQEHPGEQARSHAVEDYCKAIFTLQSRGEAPVSTNALARRLRITPGSVSAMLKKLDGDGLIVRVPYRGARLTPAGRRVALEVIRHHRLLELFLAETLEMPWDRVHAEAEVLEHVISEELEQLIAAKLGNPTLDPHGDPIPNAELELPERKPSRSLDSLDEGEGGVFVRVSDADPEMLRRRHTRAGDRWPARAGDAGGGRAMSPPPPPPPRIRADPVLEGVGAGTGVGVAVVGATVGVGVGVGGAAAGEIALGPSHLDVLLAKGRVKATLAMLGPAFVAAIAYVDPGNFATNIQGGAQLGYLLLWVVLVANLMAMLIQYLSAKLGIVTDHSLPELFRERYPRTLSWGMWVQAEVMAMATDVAEFVGAALGLNLLFGVPLLTAGIMTGFIAFAILELQSRGHRRFELAISALLGVIFLGFLYEALRIGPSARESLGGLVPHLGGDDSLYLAVGIVGATVMPHVIYLHSALTNGRTPVRNARERSRVLRFERIDVIVALGLAGLVNLAMLAVAAKLFHGTGHTGISTIEQAHAGLARMVGGGAALAFSVALLASGASSSSVGTYAGQVVMRGFVGLRIPVLARRLVTMIPAIVVLAVGLSPTSVLVLSQVVLSFGIPFALIPLVVLTCNRDVMGEHVNRRVTTVAACGLAGVITAMNVFLIWQQVF